MKRSPLSLVLLLTAACTSPPPPASQPPATTASSDKDQPDKDKDKDKDKAKELDELKDKVKKKEREIENARQEASISKLAIAADERSVKNDLEEAERDLADAQRDMDHFLKEEQDTSIAKAELALARSQWSMENDRQELHELEAMYKQDEIATLTKELVLQRGRMSLQFAEKDLALEQKALATLRDYDLPKQKHDLEVKLKKAQQALDEARAKVEKNALESKLKASKDQQGIEDLESELAKLRKELAEKQAPAAAKPEAQP